MSIEKNIGQQLNLLKDFDRVGSHEEAINKKKEARKKELDELFDGDPYKELGPDYEEEHRKREERRKEERKRQKEVEKRYRNDLKNKRRNYDNSY